MSDIAKLADELVAAKEVVEKAKAELKTAETAFAELEKAIATTMEDEGEAQVKASGRYVTLRTSSRFSIPAANKDEVYALLTTNEPTLIKPSVHAGTLTKFANEMDSSASAPDWWTTTRALLDEKTSREVAVTKSKPKSS